MAEFPDLGAHCAFENCSQLDFLPFRCSHCDQVFCKIHFGVVAHSCTQFEQHLNSEVTELSSDSETFGCSFSDCTKRELARVVCGDCRAQFCLHHRNAFDHDCPSLNDTKSVKRDVVHPVEVPDPIKTGRIMPMLTAAPPLGSEQRKKYDRVVVMKLKSRAIGEKSLPDDEKLYFEVLLPDGTTRAVFLSKRWTIGRSISGIARLCAMKNDGVVPGKKLRLCRVNYSGTAMEPFEDTSDTLDKADLCTGERLHLYYDESV